MAGNDFQILNLKPSLYLLRERAERKLGAPIIDASLEFRVGKYHGADQVTVVASIRTHAGKILTGAGKGIAEAISECVLAIGEDE